MSVADFERGRLEQTIAHLERDEIRTEVAVWHLRRQVERLCDEIEETDEEDDQ